jgi:hypothetical protein
MCISAVKTAQKFFVLCIKNKRPVSNGEPKMFTNPDLIFLLPHGNYKPEQRQKKGTQASHRP